LERGALRKVFVRSTSIHISALSEQFFDNILMAFPSCSLQSPAIGRVDISTGG
jgi:hypothetical protein